MFRKTCSGPFKHKKNIFKVVKTPCRSFRVLKSEGLYSVSEVCVCVCVTRGRLGCMCGSSLNSGALLGGPFEKVYRGLKKGPYFGELPMRGSCA